MSAPTITIRPHSFSGVQQLAVDASDIFAATAVPDVRWSFTDWWAWVMKWHALEAGRDWTCWPPLLTMSSAREILGGCDSTVTSDVRTVLATQEREWLLKQQLSSTQICLQTLTEKLTRCPTEGDDHGNDL